jgi:hypothetical protein
MKYFLLASIIFVLLVSIARADVYVVTRPDKSVYSLSELDDAVVPSGCSKDIIVGKGIADLGLSDITLYTYSNKNFTLDSKKVADKNKKAQEDAIAYEEMLAARQSGIDKLKALGLSDSEINALFAGR